MKLSEEIRRHLPTYLSAEAQADLFSELESFPDNIDARFYSGVLLDENFIFQGDALNKLLTIYLPDSRIGEGPAIIISNTCDISFENKRFLPPRFMYCPIIKLSKYVSLLKNNNLMAETTIESHLDSIKKQRISSVLFLPKGGRLTEDCIALLDRISNCALSYLSA